MKKKLLLILSLIMVLSLSACIGKETEKQLQDAPLTVDGTTTGGGIEITTTNPVELITNGDFSTDADSTLVFSLEKEGGNPCYLSGSADDKKAFLTASTTTKKYTNTFTASETNDAAKVVFLLSSAPTGAKITIDKVSLKETTIE